MKNNAIKQLRDIEHQCLFHKHNVILISHSNIEQVTLQELFDSKGIYQISQFICKPCSLDTLIRILARYQSNEKN